LILKSLRRLRGVARPRKLSERGTTVSAYVPLSLYTEFQRLAKSKGLTVSEYIYRLIVEAVQRERASASAVVADPPDALHMALKGLEPLDRERVIQFMKRLEEAEGRLARLRPDDIKLARAGRLVSSEVENVRRTVIDLRHTYERTIKRNVRSPEVLDVLGERLLELMKELGVPV
jgi:hypothetical protein